MAKDKRKAALEVMNEMLPPHIVEIMCRKADGGRFCAEMGELGIRSVFEELWIRPGLDRRARSLVTLGLLIALRQWNELKIHIGAAIKNGCTVRELEEVFYHATAYAGFPAAASGSAAAAEALRDLSLIE